MNTKLTLSVDEQIIFKAKKYAKQNKKSLSQVIENYLTYLTEEDKFDLEISSTVKKWAGSIKIEEIEMDENDPKFNYLVDKYLNA